MIDNVYTLNVSRLIEGVRIGRIAKIDEIGRVFVSLPDENPLTVPARLTSLVKLSLMSEPDPVGREVLLVFENNDSNLPVIIDTMYSPAEDAAKPAEEVIASETPKDVLVDGERITFNAGKEIVLRCGESSITLTRAGKVLLRGAYISSRSKGANRIRGKSVQVN